MLCSILIRQYRPLSDINQQPFYKSCGPSSEYSSDVRYKSVSHFTASSASNVFHC